MKRPLHLALIVLLLIGCNKNPRARRRGRPEDAATTIAGISAG